MGDMGLRVDENIQEERSESLNFRSLPEGCPSCPSTSPVFKVDCMTPSGPATAPVTRRERQCFIASSPIKLDCPDEPILSPTGHHHASYQAAQKSPSRDLGANSIQAAIPPVIEITEHSTDPGENRRVAGQQRPPSLEALCLPESAKPSSLPLEPISCLDSFSRNVHQLELCKDLGARSANRKFDISSKKSLNVDSPSFTPAQLPGGKKSTFSTNATPFTPRGAANCEFDYPIHLDRQKRLHDQQLPTPFSPRRLVSHSSKQANSRISHHRIMT